MAKEENVEKTLWVKPQLVVVTRGRPEEAVLEACKAEKAGAAFEVATGCYCQQGCAPCETIASS